MPNNTYISAQDLQGTTYAGTFETLDDFRRHCESRNTSGLIGYISTESSTYYYDRNTNGMIILETNITTPSETISISRRDINDYIETTYVWDYDGIHEVSSEEREAVLRDICEQSQQISNSFINFNSRTGRFEYHPSDEQVLFPYQPSEQELNDYDFYLRRRDPSCRNEFPIAIGHLKERFLNIINANLREMGIE